MARFRPARKYHPFSGSLTISTPTWRKGFMRVTGAVSILDELIVFRYNEVVFPLAIAEAKPRRTSGVS